MATLQRDSRISSKTLPALDRALSCSQLLSWAGLAALACLLVNWMAVTH